MNIVGGACAKCGAPFYLPDVWMGIVPPTPQPTCGCWNVPMTVTSSSTVSIDGVELGSHRADLLELRAVQAELETVKRERDAAMKDAVFLASQIEGWRQSNERLAKADYTCTHGAPQLLCMECDQDRGLMKVELETVKRELELCRERLPDPESGAGAFNDALARTLAKTRRERDCNAIAMEAALAEQSRLFAERDRQYKRAAEAERELARVTESILLARDALEQIREDASLEANECAGPCSETAYWALRKMYVPIPGRDGAE